MTSRSYQATSGGLHREEFGTPAQPESGISFASDCVTGLEMLDILDIWNI
jgi:hypothetical protein